MYNDWHVCLTKSGILKGVFSICTYLSRYKILNLK